MKYVVFNFAGANTKDDVQDIIAQSLQTPEYYGRNLDALHDVLTSQSEDIAIDVDGADEAAEGIQDYIARVQTVIKDAVNETAGNTNGRVLSVDILAGDDED